MYIGSQFLMKKYDEYLINKGYSIEDLVDKASDVLIKYMKKDSYALFCGPGNNGADGLSLAIKLKNKNKKVKVYIFDHQHTSDAFQYYYNLCQENNIDIVILDIYSVDSLQYELKDVEVVVDAIFGFGLNGPIRGIYAMIIDEINLLFEQDIISVDIPSGLNCNSGMSEGSVVLATQTITFNALKNCFLNLDTRLYTGELIIDFLDVEDICEEVGLFELYEKKHALMTIKKRLFNGHKGTYGKIAMIAGCTKYKGAALLSTKAAVYSGAGLVTLISDESVLDACSLFVQEAITSSSIDLSICYDALLLGSGLGLSEESEQKVYTLLTKAQVPIVLDGDALTIVSDHLELLKDYKEPIIVTPHLGEFKRLCHTSNIEDELIAAKQFALQNKVIVVLKGPYTIVTDGYESYRVHSGNKAMATAGMGDVLSGIITSLLGQGYSAINAAALGVYIHGYCGDILAKHMYTVIPSQLIEQIPKTMKEFIDLQHKNN